MLSSISGLYFAGHTGTAAVAPPPTVVNYNSLLGSYPGTGFVINDVSGNGWNLTTAPPTLLFYSANTPQSFQYWAALPWDDPGSWFTFERGITEVMPAGVNNPSRTSYQTISFWYRQILAPILSSGSASLFEFRWADDVPFPKGVFMDQLDNGKLFVNIRTQSRGDGQQTLPNNTTTLNTWQMITFKYILNATSPCVVYINGAPVYSYISGSEVMDFYYPSRLFIRMSARFGQWNDFILANDEYTDAMVLARFNATRSNYGV